jgi:D-arabinitol 2-dehydrogenase
MASLRVRMAMCQLARPAFVAVRCQPITWSVQQRGLASQRDVTCAQIQYEKDESTGGKMFSQFDLEGKVFVVTGVAAGYFQTVAMRLYKADP